MKGYSYSPGGRAGSRLLDLAGLLVPVDVGDEDVRVVLGEMAEGDAADAIGVAGARCFSLGGRGGKGNAGEGEGDGSERGLHFDELGLLFGLVETMV